MEHHLKTFKRSHLMDPCKKIDWKDLHKRPENVDACIHTVCPLHLFKAACVEELKCL